MLSMLLWQRLNLEPLVIALAAIALGVLLWLYPSELGRSNRRWRWALPVLRAGVIVALAISMLRPVSARPKSSPEHGKVVFLVDQSRSMQIRDTGRTPTEAMALARGLGLLPAGRRPASANLQLALDDLRVMVDRVARAQSEAAYARLAGRGIEQARQRLEEATAAMRASAGKFAASASKVGESGDLGRRLAELRRLPPALDERSLRELRAQLDRIGGDLTAIEARADAGVYEHNPRIRHACDALQQLSRTGLVRRALFDPDHGLARKLGSGTFVEIYGFSDRPQRVSASSIDDQDASGDQSDILGAVQSLRQRLRGQPVEAIVLVSDGRQVGSDSDSAKSLQGSGLPVFAVGVASPHDRRDVSVTGIKAPDWAFVGESVPVRVEIRALECHGQKLEVTLDGPSGRQVRQIAAGDSVDLAAEFNVRFGSAGAAEISAEVAPVPGEATNANNHAEHWVKVVDQTVPIAVVSGSNSRDYQAACKDLKAAPWISLRSFLVSGDVDTLPLTPDEIGRQQVLILMDVPVWSLSAAQWDAVEQLVEKNGGSVILEVGDSDVLQEYEDDPVVSRLLPFDPIADVSWRQWPGEEPRYSLVEAQWAGALPAEQQPSWPRLGAVLKYLAMPQLKPNALAMLVDRETGAAAMAQTRLGLGRSFLIGVDETWRWQTPAGGLGGGDFWKPLLRDALREPYAIREGNYALDADQIYLMAPAPLHVRARFLGTATPPDSQELQVFRDGDLVATQTMWPAASAGPGRYQTALKDLSPGQYELRLVTGDELTPEPRLTVRVGASSEAELADLSGDNGLLRRIADSTGGQFITLDQLPSLPARLEEARERERPWLEYPLWDSPYLFLFVLAALSLEWALRKQAGLA